MSFFAFMMDHVLSLSSVLNVGSQSVSAPAYDVMMKTLR